MQDKGPILVGALLERRYRVDAPLARGGMSAVYRGVDTRLDRPVAIKVMDPRFADDRSFVERFEREARSAARIHHPNVVAVHDQGLDGDHVYLVMELVDGATLRDLLAERGALPAPLAVSILDSVLSALAAAHEAGLVHRDVKPENVLIGRGGVVKVADFGLVRAMSSPGTTRSSVILGTVSYLSPEQVSTGDATARGDVYSAGIVLYEMLTGAPPYHGDNPLTVAYRHVNDDVPAPGTRVRGVPPLLDELVVRATRRDPATRPADAAAFLAELRRVREALSLPRMRVPVPGAQAEDPRGARARQAPGAFPAGAAHGVGAHAHGPAVGQAFPPAPGAAPGQVPGPMPAPGTPFSPAPAPMAVPGPPVGPAPGATAIPGTPPLPAPGHTPAPGTPFSPTSGPIPASGMPPVPGATLAPGTPIGPTLGPTPAPGMPFASGGAAVPGAPAGPTSGPIPSPVPGTSTGPIPGPPLVPEAASAPGAPAGPASGPIPAHGAFPADGAPTGPASGAFPTSDPASGATPVPETPSGAAPGTPGPDFASGPIPTATAAPTPAPGTALPPGTTHIPAAAVWTAAPTADPTPTPGAGPVPEPTSTTGHTGPNPEADRDADPAPATTPSPGPDPAHATAAAHEAAPSTAPALDAPDTGSGARAPGAESTVSAGAVDPADAPTVRELSPVAPPQDDPEATVRVSGEAVAAIAAAPGSATVVRSMPRGFSAAGPQGTRALLRSDLEKVIAAAQPEGQQPPPPATGPQPVPGRSRRGPILLGIVGLLVLALVGAGVWWFTSGRYTQVPDVHGQDAAAAEQALRTADLTPSRTTVRHNEVPAGVVVSTEPGPGAEALRGDEVRLVVSSGRPVVPDVPAGSTPEQAEQAISAAELQPQRDDGRNVHDEQVPKGRVVRLDPPAGTTLDLGQRVVVVLSKGPAPKPVPDVRGKTRDEAFQELQAAGFEPYDGAPEFAGDVDGGRVIRTDPAAATVVPAEGDKRVAVVLSTAVTVPDLNGKTVPEAQAVLTGLGLTIELQPFTNPNGRIFVQSPGPGTRVEKGAKVAVLAF